MMRLLLLLFFCQWIVTEAVTTQNTKVPSKPSVVRLGALFTINSVIGRSAKPAILAAIKDVNDDTTILPGIKMEVILYDTDCSGFSGTVKGITHHIH